MMQKSTLVDRIEKAEEFIEKKELTIEKKTRQAAKKEKKLLESYGIVFEKMLYSNELAEMGFSRDDAHDIYWLMCDIDNLYDDVKRLRKEVAKKSEKLDEYKAQLAEVRRVEDEMAKEVPEAFTKARAELVDMWTQWDIEARDRMLEYKKTVDYHTFYQSYKYSRYEELNHTDEELRQYNEKDADLWLIDLYNRVKEVTGTITDAQHIHFVGKALNGLVIGENGTARVETIGAGGWNIQKYHLRVLVHKYIKEGK